MALTLQKPLLGHIGRYLAELAGSVVILAVAIAALDGIAHLFHYFGLAAGAIDIVLFALALAAFVLFFMIIARSTTRLGKELRSAWRRRRGSGLTPGR